MGIPLDDDDVESFLVTRETTGSSFPTLFSLIDAGLPGIESVTNVPSCNRAETDEIHSSSL